MHMIRKRPSVLECGGCEGRSTAPLHSRSVRSDELNFRSSTPSFGSTTKLQHIQFDCDVLDSKLRPTPRNPLLHPPLGHFYDACLGHTFLPTSYPQNRVLWGLGNAKFDDGLGWNLDLLLRLWIKARARLPLLLYEFRNPGTTNSPFFLVDL